MKNTALALITLGILALAGWWAAGSNDGAAPPAIQPIAAGGELQPSSGGVAPPEESVASTETARVEEAAGPVGEVLAPCTVRLVDERGQLVDGAEAWWVDAGSAVEVEGLEGGVLQAAGIEQPAALLARAPGYQLALLELEVRSGVHELVLSAASASLHGLVLVDGELPPEPLELRFAADASAAPPSPAVQRAREAGLELDSGRQTITTDDSGRYRLDGLEPGWVGTVRLPRGYWFAQSPEGGTVERGRYERAYLARTGEVHLQLTRLPRLRGQLVWADDGAPVRDAALNLSVRFEGGGQTPMTSLATDDEGRFHLVLSPSTADLRERFLKPEGRRPVREVELEVQASEGLAARFELGSEEIGVDGDLGVLEVQRGRELHLRVVDELGQPIPGALSVAGGERFGSPTDEDGRVVLTGLEERIDVLSVTAPGRELVHVRPGPGGGAEDPLTVTLGPGNELVIEFVDGEGEVPTDLQLELATEGQLFEDGGEPGLPGVGQLHYFLNRDSQSGMLRDQRETVMRLDGFEPAGRVSIHGLADGVQLSARVVSRYGETLEEVRFSGPTGGERMERRIVFEDEGFELRGRVVDESGSALPAARVRLRYQRAKVDAEGRFSFASLHSSTEPYDLEVSMEGHATVVQRELYPTSDLDLGDLVLPAGRELLVEVRDEAGAALGGAHALLALADGYLPPRGRELEPGLMQLRDLPPVEVEVRLHFGWHEYSTVAAVGVERVRFTVPVHGALQLELPAGLALPEEGSLVAELVSEALPDGPEIIPFRESSGRMTRELRALPGTYTVRLVRRWYEDHELRLEPLDGAWQVEVGTDGVTRLTLDG